MNVRTNLMLPDDLVSEVDRLAGPRGRSRYVAEAIRSRLRRDRLREVVELTSGAWSAAEYPEFATPEAVVTWVRARRLERADREPGA